MKRIVVVSARVERGRIVRLRRLHSRCTMKFRGQVVAQPIARGSKSERTAVMLKTPRRDYVLRREGGNPFLDPELDDLVGHTIEGEGIVHGYVLIMSKWRIVE